MKTIQIIIALLISQILFAQTEESYDLLSYTAPKGWKKEIGNGFVSHSITDSKTGNYAKLVIYKSLAGTGNLKIDFDTEWNDLVATPLKTNDQPETSEEDLLDGWKVKTGVAPFTFNNRMSVATLITGISNGNKISMLIIANTETYQTDMELFGNSIKFKKAPPVTAKTTGTSPSGSSSLNVSNGYTFATSNFNDGWVSNIEADWVSVKKNDINVYILYALPYNSDNFSGTGVMERDYYWDNYVSTYFSIQTRQYQDAGEFISSFKPNYVEGWATDKQSGQKRFIAMTLSIAPNTAFLIIGTAPDENSLHSTFPKANDRYTSDLTAMNRYNKFAIGAKDLTGKWQNGNTSTAQWFYISPSGYEGYAGMTLAASSATFNFNANGSYSSIHNGATGAVGNMGTFQQEYKGTYTVSNWSITATNRYGGKTDTFDASFMAVRGGRILKLNNGAGQEYSLVKIR